MGRKQEAGHMAHFGYQILPRLLQDWCEGHNMSGARVGMMSGMKRIQELQAVSGVELTKVIKKKDEEKTEKGEERTPKINNMRNRKETKGEIHPRKGHGMEEIKEMMKRMEERIMKQINGVEDKIDILMKRMEPQWVIER